MHKKNRFAGLIIGIVFILIAAIILIVGLLSEFTILSAALAVLLLLTGIQIARGKM
ncbi:hypothetical protein KY329_04405 [Candidatus Woesearchaeota archaeon]|nr:hypothetical protein [Candidatus Woesearchaeota archaeon]